MNLLSNILYGRDTNEEARQRWLTQTLASLPAGLRILDAGAGELRNKPLCSHLRYVSQDLCQYEGQGNSRGLQTGRWDTGKIDLICDIQSIPEPDASFDVILCSEVFEHLPDPLGALTEFERLLKPAGKLITTAPFGSLVHFAPYHYASGFSRYWYEYHFPLKGLEIVELSPNGNWFSFVRQEILRIPSVARKYGEWSWPLAYGMVWIARAYFHMIGNAKSSADLACLGWHCVSVKRLPR